MKLAHFNYSKVTPLAKRMTSSKRRVDFNPRVFLSSIGEGRNFQSFEHRDTIFAQGDRTDGISFIQKGKVRLSVVSEAGKEATIGIMGSGDFIGEGGLAGQLVRMSSATAMTDCDILHIDKKAMMDALRLEPTLSALFLKYLLKRNIRYQDDLVDQLFNSSEKRLARVLLLMARFGKEGVSEMSIPRISQEILAEMVGTTRSRVSFFMNRFRKLGFLDYDAGNNLLIHSSLLNIVLQDDNASMEGDGGRSGARAAKGVEPPAAPGEPPDRERAHGPHLPRITACPN